MLPTWVTVTEPPTPLTEGRASRAFSMLPCTPTPPLGGTLYASELVVEPLKVRVNVPDVPVALMVIVWISETVPPRALSLRTFRTPPLTDVRPLYVLALGKIKVPRPTLVRLPAGTGIGVGSWTLPV